MANKYIYLLLTIAYLKLTETYFLNDDLGSNLPDLYGDPIDENWQEKRSVVKNHPASFDDLSNIKKDLTDYDYRDGNADTVVEQNIDEKEKMKKRENEIHGKFDESLSKSEIEQILSQLSNTELNSLKNLMVDENPIADVDKRESSERKFGGNYNFKKRCDSKIQCEHYACDEYNRSPLKEERYIVHRFHNQIPDKITMKRKLNSKRSSGRPTTRENILQAKISLLKDNYKRNSEMAKMENSLKSKTVNTSGNSEIRMPYRKNRSAHNTSTEQNKEDDSVADENARLQEVPLESNEFHD